MVDLGMGDYCERELGSPFKSFQRICGMDFVYSVHYKSVGIHLFTGLAQEIVLDFTFVFLLAVLCQDAYQSGQLIYRPKFCS